MINLYIKCIRVKVDRYFMVSQFQKVVEIEMMPDGQE